MSNQGSAVQQSPLAAHTAGLPSQVTAKQQGTSGIQGAASTDSKSSGRKELPAVRHMQLFVCLYLLTLVSYFLIPCNTI
jgi:hypothetical protein